MKTNAQHTPVPWLQPFACEADNTEPPHCDLTTPTGGLIARFYYGKTNAERLANAKLCAAAPDMLKALKDTQATLSRLSDYVARDKRASAVAFAQDALLQKAANQTIIIQAEAHP